MNKCSPNCVKRPVPALVRVHYSGGMAYAVEKTDAEWREELSPEEYAVLRKAGTERAFTGEYTDTETKGVYSLQGLPRQALRVGHQVPLRLRLAVVLPADHRHRRVHRGHHPRHEAGRGPLRQLRLAPRATSSPTATARPTGDRYCINSISLTLEPADPAETV